MHEMLGDRPVALARELTKLHEELRRGTLASLAIALSDELLRGEFVIIVGPPTVVAVTDLEITEQLAVLCQTLSLRDASRELAEKLGIAKSRVYGIGVKIKRSSNERG